MIETPQSSGRFGLILGSSFDEATKKNNETIFQKNNK